MEVLVLKAFGCPGDRIMRLVGREAWLEIGSYIVIPSTSCVSISLCPALTEVPNIQVTSTLVSGNSTKLLCSVPWACEQGTPPIFSWMSSALTSLGHRTTLSSELNLTPRPQDNGTNLTCQVNLPGPGVTVERTQQLSVICECPDLGLWGGEIRGVGWRG